MSNFFSTSIRRMLFGASLLFLAGSCNRDFPNLLHEFGAAQDPDPIQDKVLLIVVDGLSGAAVQELEPTNFRVLARNAILSYSSLADSRTDAKISNEAVWATLMTGVSAEKNGVTTDNLTQLNTADYPTMFMRLHNMYQARSSTLYTSSAIHAEALASGTASVQIDTDDDAVVAKATARLQIDTTALQVVHLTALEAAGEASGFTAASPMYAAAIGKLDAQVKQLIDVLHARQSYPNENWLVVITSGKGGLYARDTPDFTAFGDTERETFTMLYSPKFSARVLARPSVADIPYSGSAVNYRYNANVRAVSGNTQVGNIEASKSYTIQFLYKSNHMGALSWPAILGKRPSADGGTGWTFINADQGCQFHTSIGVAGNSNVQIKDGKWHAITGVFNRATNRLILYVDGVAGNPANVNGNETAINSHPLIIGTMPSSGNMNAANYLIANLQIYEYAFSQEDVERYAGLTWIDENHPYYASLIGYWPGYEDVNTNTLTEKTGKAPNFRLDGQWSWASFNELVDFLQPPITASIYRMVPNAVDIPFIIYQWLGVSVEQSWALDGKSWSPNFIRVRN
ncbi:LamG-like jellyroll fold domain-containing protein [Sphingobacterium griseoflavum]|nr:LamG-like jellyroll fold domain-containing protein [Sphingobacterium griseoflavum]